MPGWVKRVALGVTVLLAAIGGLDAIWSLFDRLQAGVDLGALIASLVDAARLASGPIALVIAILLWRGRPQRDPARVIRPEWDSMNQLQHYEAVRRFAIEAQTDLDRTISMGDPTVRDQGNLKALADSVDLQVSTYSDMWTRGTYWADRSRWDASGIGHFEGPTWAQPLGERIAYAVNWLREHDPSWTGEYRRGTSSWEDLSGR